MSNFKVGDIVSRKSHGHDIVFKVVDIKVIKDEADNIVVQGIDYRIEADAPEDDLKLLTESESHSIRRPVDKWSRSSLKRIKAKRDEGLLPKINLPFARSTVMFNRTGKILHLDGASDFLQKCKDHYAQLGLNAIVLGIAEKDQPARVKELLEQYSPDILVLTGHDGVIGGEVDYNNISNYRNSAYFVSAVQEARKYEKSLEDLVIFAGACQSDYEAILNAGANFSSSPKRVLIHMYDPVTIAEKVAATHIDKVLLIDEVVKGISSGFDGIGGLQTRGKARSGGPKGVY